MLNDRIEQRWLAAFRRVFGLCKLSAGDQVAILAETQSRTLNRELARLALEDLGVRVFEITVPTPSRPRPSNTPTSSALRILGFDGAMPRSRAT